MQLFIKALCAKLFMTLALCVAHQAALAKDPDAAIPGWRLSEVICIQTCDPSLLKSFTQRSTERLQFGNLYRSRFTDLDWCEGETQLETQKVRTTTVKTRIRQSSRSAKDWEWSKLRLPKHTLEFGHVKCTSAMAGNATDSTIMLTVVTVDHSRLLIWLDGPVFLNFVPDKP